jgi:hypothetical protein
MKITLDIPDPLLREARKLEQREHTTLWALVERGLLHVLAEKHRRPAFRLRKASFKARGLHPDMKEASSEQVRELAYGDRGG